MKIQSLFVEELFGCREPININFDQNIHVLSGKNGAGKTTILKLVWYFISGNLEKALIEIPFKHAILHTDIYTLHVSVSEDQDPPFSSKIIYKNKDLIDPAILDIDPIELNPHVRHVLTKFIGSSFFFPTFRNIEGGFTTEKYNIKHEIFQSLLLNNSQKNPDPVDLIHDLKVLSSKISNIEHKFVTSVSASNINDLLISRYAEIMSHTQPFQSKRKDLSDTFIKSFIFSADGKAQLSPETNQETVNELQNELQNIENEIEQIRKPLKRFHDSIAFFLKDYKFIFGQKVQFSKVSQESNKKSSALKSILGLKTEHPLFDISILSAGEKQILMLIGYNSLFDNTIFFIDEPEISLHADWQRILFRILMKQNPSNQFIITTQSPFIYSKYPKNEICLDPAADRGDSKE